MSLSGLELTATPCRPHGTSRGRLTGETTGRTSIPCLCQPIRRSYVTSTFKSDGKHRPSSWRLGWRQQQTNKGGYSSKRQPLSCICSRGWRPSETFGKKLLPDLRSSIPSKRKTNECFNSASSARVWLPGVHVIVTDLPQLTRFQPG